MELNSGLIMYSSGALISAGVAFGIVRGKMSNYTNLFETHRKMCAAQSEATNRKLDTIDSNIKELIEKVGILKGKTE